VWVTCETAACVHRLPRATLARLGADDPLFAAALDRLVADLATTRGVDTTAALERAAS
jgi:hypothetical protein